MEFYKSVNVCCHLRRKFLCVLIICLLWKCLASSVLRSIECRCHQYWMLVCLLAFLSISLLHSHPLFCWCYSISFILFFSFYSIAIFIIDLTIWLHRFVFSVSFSAGRYEIHYYWIENKAWKTSAIWHDMTWQSIANIDDSAFFVFPANGCHWFDVFLSHSLCVFVICMPAIPFRN